MIVHDAPLSFYVDKLIRKENFRFMRIGDGEMWCYSGLKKDIGRGEHNVLFGLTKDIRYILDNLDSNHIYGLQSLIINNSLHPEWSEWIPDYEWYNSDVFHRASAKGQLHPFIKALEERFVVIVSCAKTRAVPIQYNGFIEVREANCYNDKERVLEEMNTFPEDTVFLFSASRLSVPAIYFSKRNDCTMIDIGSLFEPYLGNATRGYHHNVTREIIKKNLGK